MCTTIICCIKYIPTCWTVEVEPACCCGARRTEDPGLGRTTKAISAAGAHRATIARKGGAIVVGAVELFTVHSRQSTHDQHDRYIATRV